MTISSNIQRGDYSCNGATTAFSVPFPFFLTTEIQVLKTDTTVTPNTVTTLVNGTDYTVTGGAGSTGTFTTAATYATGMKLTVLPNLPFTQATHYVAGDAFPAASHEAALDRLTLQDQQLEEKLNRAVVIPPQLTGVSGTLPLPLANASLVWDPTATFLTNGATATTVTTIPNLTGDVTSVGNATTLAATQAAVHTWSAQQTYNANLGLLVAPTVDTALNIGGTLASSVAASQQGVSVQPKPTSSATSSFSGIYFRGSSAAAAYTVASTYGGYIDTPSKGAGSTMTTAYGLYVAAQNQATTNYAIYTNAGLVYHGDNVGILSTPTVDTALRMTGSLSNSVAVSQTGFDLEVLPSSSATGSLTQLYTRPRSAAAAYTQSSAYAFYVDTPSVGAGSTITTSYGLYIANQTGAGTGYAIRTNTGLVLIGDATASTTKTNGALVVTGGVGISGALNLGGKFTMTAGVNFNYTNVADTAYTALATDAMIVFGTLTASRIVTLPTASSAGAGAEYRIRDGSGSASGTITISVARSGSDTINGQTTNQTVISSAYGQAVLVSDGVSKWGFAPAASATANPLNLPLVANASPVAGDIWNDSTKKSTMSFPDGIKQALTGVIDTATAAITDASNNVANTIYPNGTITLPANFFTVGKTVRIKLKGTITNAGTPSMRFQTILGGTIVSDTTAVPTVTITGTGYWEYECDITCRTTGVSGTVIANGRFMYTNGTTPLVFAGASNTATTIDTTTSKTVVVNDTWSISSASNSITMNIGTTEVLN